MFYQQTVYVLAVKACHKESTIVAKIIAFTNKIFHLFICFDVSELLFVCVFRDVYSNIMFLQLILVLANGIFNGKINMMLTLMVGVGQRCSGSYSSTKRTKAAIYIAMFLHVLVFYCSSAYEDVVWWIFKKNLFKHESICFHVSNTLFFLLFYLSVCYVSLKENYQFYLGKTVRNPKFHIWKAFRICILYPILALYYYVESFR